MKIKLLFLFLVSFLVSNLIIAQKQNYRTSTLDRKSNYFEIVKQKRKELSSLEGKTDQKSRKQIKQFERWAAFWKDRILPDGSFVSATHNYNEFKKEKERNSQRTLKEAITAKWSSIGPSKKPHSTSNNNASGIGRINTVAFNGANADTLYVGSPSGGIWKTINGGTTWLPKGDSLGNMGVSDIVINPKNTNILYLATGDWDAVHTRSIGVFKSINGGDTWSITGLAFTLNENNIISKLLIDSNNTNTVFATTQNSIKRTTDGGTTWTDVITEKEAFFNDIVYKIGSGTILYATSKTGKFYISTNNGTNWTVASTPAKNRLDLALTANDANLILTIDGGGVVRKSTNQGSTWATLSTIQDYENQGGYNQTLAISPINKNLILAGGIAGLRSTDGGLNWEVYLDASWVSGNPYSYAHADHHDMKFIPGTNTAFDVNDGGIIKGDASLNTAWTDLSAGLAITQYYSVGGTPQNGEKLLAGAQDNDVTLFDNAIIKAVTIGDGVNGLIDYSNQNIAWVCGQHGFLLRSINNFTSIDAASNTPSGAPFNWELEIHPTVPTTIFGGFSDIYKSTNRGDTWTNLKSEAGAIEHISIAPSNANIIYVSGEGVIAGFGKVKKTIDGGTTWTDVNLPNDEGFIKSIEVHPRNPDEVYIVYAGYVAANKVYKSTDGGATWTNITGTLPDVPAHQIIYKTGSNKGELFLATDLGVYYYRTNPAGDWVKFGTGLPNVIINDIEIFYGNEKIRVATYGRGIWEAPIGPEFIGTEDQQLPENSINIYPNPTSNKKFNIKLNNLKGESNILIYNLIGSVVKNLNVSKTEEKIDLNNFSSGIYFVSISNNGKSLVKKIIVK